MGSGEGVLFEELPGSLLPGTATCPQTPGSRAPTSQGQAGVLRAAFPAAFSPPFLPTSPPKFPAPTTISPKSPLFWPRGWVTSPGKPPTPGAKGPGEGTEEGGGHTGQSFPNPLVYLHPLPGLSHSLHPLHPQPRRFIPELTAWRRAERVKQK